MAERIKLRLSRLILFFRFCRSKNPSNLPKHHKFSPTLFSVAGGGLDGPKSDDFRDFKWKKADNFHLIEKVVDDDDGDDTAPRRKIYNSGRQRKRRGKKSFSGETAPARLSEFMRSVVPACGAAVAATAAEGKLRESLAVVKRSKDPYGDFKRSMMEMIIDKELFEEGELEQLLGCLLSLNSRNYHGIIVQAFADIWVGSLFCGTSNPS